MFSLVPCKWHQLSVLSMWSDIHFINIHYELAHFHRIQCDLARRPMWWCYYWLESTPSVYTLTEGSTETALYNVIGVSHTFVSFTFRTHISVFRFRCFDFRMCMPCRLSVFCRSRHSLRYIWIGCETETEHTDKRTTSCRIHSPHSFENKSDLCHDFFWYLLLQSLHLFL